MFKKMQKRIATLCTCVTLMAAMPVSMEGCMEDGAWLIGGGSTTEVISTSTASASAGNGVATATASTSTTTTTTGGVFGGYYGGMPSDDGSSYYE